MNQRKIRFNDIAKDYDVGELLIDFLDLDFQPYDKQRQGILADLKNKSKIKDKQSYVVNWLIDEVEGLKDQHPYFRIINKDVLAISDYQELLDNTFDLVKIQELFNKVIEFCLCSERMSELESMSALQRYYIYHALHNSPFERMGISAKVLYEPMNIESGLPVNIGGLDLPNLLAFVKDEDNLFFAEQYFGQDIASLLYVEFNKMVALNIRVKVCERCGRFFALKGLRPARYCTRPLEEYNGDTAYNCRTISATQHYKEKLSEDQDYKTYRATYKRLNVRKNKNLITGEQYADLTKKIADLRRDLLEGKISPDIYKKQMDNI